LGSLTTFREWEALKRNKYWDLGTWCGANKVHIYWEEATSQVWGPSMHGNLPATAGVEYLGFAH
jgi:hypothetical protein